MKDELLLCCDLDRTVLPNGHRPESPGAREIFRRLTEDERVTLVYVSGRDRRLLLEAIDAYQIPVPDYAIGDVGTTIYRISNDHWSELESWAVHIGEDWHGITVDEMVRYLSGINALSLQEPEKQNRFKLSYYAPADVDVLGLLAAIREIFSEQKIRANLIWSIDEIDNVGLLDILPARANKLHSIEFLMRALGVDRSQVVFAGDSGNDLPVVVSDIPSVLVGNASDEVKKEAEIEVHASGNGDYVYTAKGGFHGLNGNYCAGIVEGVVHYHPRFEALL